MIDKGNVKLKKSIFLQKKFQFLQKNRKNIENRFKISEEENYMKLKELFKKVSVSGMLAAFALCMTTLADK